MGGTLKARIYFQLEQPTSSSSACLTFDTLLGQRVFAAHSLFEPQNSWGERVGKQVFVCEIPSLTLVPGECKIKAALDVQNPDEDCVEDATRLTILESDYYGTGKLPRNGAFVLKHRWYLGGAQER